MMQKLKSKTMTLTAAPVAFKVLTVMTLFQLMLPIPKMILKSMMLMTQERRMILRSPKTVILLKMTKMVQSGALINPSLSHRRDDLADSHN